MSQPHLPHQFQTPQVPSYDTTSSTSLPQPLDPLQQVTAGVQNYAQRNDQTVQQLAEAIAGLQQGLDAMRAQMTSWHSVQVSQAVPSPTATSSPTPGVDSAPLSSGRSVMASQVKVPNFSSNGKVLASLWLDRVERAFSAYGVTSDRDKLALVPSWLEGDAEVWWGFRRRNAPFSSWEEFRTAFERQYVIAGSQLYLRRQQNELRQTGTVSEYVRAFTLLDNQIVNMSDFDRASRFRMGLKPAVQKHLQVIGGQEGTPLYELMAAASSFGEIEDPIRLKHSFGPLKSEEPTHAPMQLDAVSSEWAKEAQDGGVAFSQEQLAFLA